MKKSLIALAVAGAMTAPMVAMADATLYGHVNIEVRKDDGSKMDIGGAANSVSRIGVRGTADTGVDGLVGFYHIEMGLATPNGATALNTRLAHAGLRGDFGSFALGTQWTPHYLWTTGQTDVMLSGAARVLRSTDSVYRASNSAMYISPNMSGLQFGAGILASEARTDKNVDAYNVAARYSADSLTVALSHLSAESSGLFSKNGGSLSSATAIAATYDFGVGSVSAGYSRDRYRNASNQNPFELAATYNVTDSTTLKAAYSDFRGSAKGYAVEVQHNLGSMTNLYLGYGEANSSLEAMGVADTLSTGIRVRF